MIEHSVVVLAGGFAKRLGAQKTPKCLLQLGGVRILDLILRQLLDQGVERVVLALNHRADEIWEYASRQFYGGG